MIDLVSFRRCQKKSISPTYPQTCLKEVRYFILIIVYVYTDAFRYSSRLARFNNGLLTILRSRKRERECVLMLGVSGNIWLIHNRGELFLSMFILFIYFRLKNFQLPSAKTNSGTVSYVLARTKLSIHLKSLEFTKTRRCV